jgi:cation diffusion facilitator CzcD-associated flavoprotein CzcO
MANSEMPSGINGVNGTGHPYDYPPANPEGEYRIIEQYHSKPSKIRVACCGAGASGLCLAYKMEKMLTPGSWELTLFEKNEQFGGTWYENTYPGVACDIPAHDYNFTWDPKPDWTQFFAAGPEIQRYFEDFAERYGELEIMHKRNHASC